MSLETDVKQVKQAGYWMEIGVNPGEVWCAIWTAPDASGMQNKVSEAEGRAVAATVNRAVKAIPKKDKTSKRGRSK